MLFRSITVLVSLLGAGWTLWERSQHDPWLRLLAKARKHLTKAGIDSTAATTPRQLAELLRVRGQAHECDQLAPLQAWLLQLEAQRYAAGAANAPLAKKLRQQLKRVSRGLPTNLPKS